MDDDFPLQLLLDCEEEEESPQFLERSLQQLEDGRVLFVCLACIACFACMGREMIVCRPEALRLCDCVSSYDVVLILTLACCCVVVLLCCCYSIKLSGR